ncbi:MAG: flippase-like domain-containing protein [Ignavibacteria bacterium]|nr:flippase-like domain-containing protein [Ignavibacteria bacterium]
MLSVGLAVIFLYLAFSDVNFGEVMKLVSQASIIWVIIFSASIMLGHYVRALRWKYILYSVKPDVKMWNLFGALMIGYGVNCVTPKLGEVTRAIMIGRYENLSRSSMFGTVIVERVIDIISLGAAVLISAFIWSASLYVTFPWLEVTLYISAIALVVVLVMIYLSVKFKEKFYSYFTKIIGKFSQKLAERLGYIFEMLIQGFTTLKGTKNYVLTFLTSVIILLIYALTSYIGFFMLNMQSEHIVTFKMGWILMSISAIGVVIPTPGSTGSYHALAKNTLVLLFGFGDTISAAYAFLTHIISYFLFIIVALIMYFALNRQHTSIFNLLKTNSDDQ